MPLTLDQLALVRRMINEPTDSDGWTDVVLLASAEAYFLNGDYDLRSLSASIWEEKAAKVAELVNVSESGSSRSLSQIFDHYMAMAKRFHESTGEETTVVAYPRSTRMVRASREV